MHNSKQDYNAYSVKYCTFPIARKDVILSIIKTQSNVQVTCGIATTKSETREENDYYATPQGSRNVARFGNIR